MSALRRQDRLDRRAYSKCTRHGLCRFPVIITGSTPRPGLIGNSPVDRSYNALRRALLKNKGRVGSGQTAFAHHTGAWRMLCQRTHDHDIKEAWRNHNEMTARGYVRGYMGRWVLCAAIARGVERVA